METNKVSQSDGDMLVEGWQGGRRQRRRRVGVGGGGEGPSVSPGKSGKWSMPSGNCHSVLFKG